MAALQCDTLTRAAGNLNDNGSTVSQRGKSTENRLTLEDLQQKGLFDVTLSEAASRLKLSTGSLKRECRKLGLLRWPYRARKSLRSVISKTEQYLEDEGSKKGVLDALAKRLKDTKGQDALLDGSMRKYRQAVFKLNHSITKRAAQAKQPKLSSVAAEQMLQAGGSGVFGSAILPSELPSYPSESSGRCPRRSMEVSEPGRNSPSHPCDPSPAWWMCSQSASSPWAEGGDLPEGRHLVLEHEADIGDSRAVQQSPGPAVVPDCSQAPHPLPWLPDQVPCDLPGVMPGSLQFKPSSHSAYGAQLCSSYLAPLDLDFQIDPFLDLDAPLRVPDLGLEEAGICRNRSFLPTQRRRPGRQLQVECALDVPQMGIDVAMPSLIAELEDNVVPHDFYAPGHVLG